MNYFELHVGDYEAATAHLSMLEDAAYCRMLRIYYRTESPLPADVKQVCRLARAVSKPEREAVDQVLRDFFDLREDGWHQIRADKEIAEYLAGEPERQARKANEDTRLQRHREDRARLFQALTEAGQHAPWNIGIRELRAIAGALQKPVTETQPATPATAPATAPATPATATQYPVPSTQYPVPSIKTNLLPPVGGSGSPQSVGPPTPPPAFDGNNAAALNGKSVVLLANNFELPEPWGMDAEALGWKPGEVLREAEKYRQYWVVGRGAGTRRSVTGWRQTWSTWLGKAAKDMR